MKSLRFFGLLPAFLLPLILGCNKKNGIHEVMAERRFAELTPPTLWEPGSVVQIDPATPDAPAIRSSPSMSGAAVLAVPAPTGDITHSHDDKADRNLGFSLTEKSNAGAAANGDTQTSVV